MEQIIKDLYSQYLDNPIITTDSRKCPLGSIFFALKGDKFDGNQYAKSALEQGCRLAVVDDVTLKDSEGMFFVDNVLSALQALANYHRNQLGIPIIGITGSNGKTTTKELVSAVLSRKNKIYFTQGNLNNHIGVPLTLLSMNTDTEIGVVEMGANHSGEIRELCDIADPDMGIITNIGKAHIEGFGSFEGVKNTKGELYTHVKNKDGLLFVNSDDDLLMEMSNSCRRMEYSTSESNVDVTAKNIIVNPFLGFDLIIGEEIKHVQTNLVGSYNVTNFLAAACIGIRFDVPMEEICRAFEEYTPVNNRSQLIKGEKNQILMDAYNANPSSMQKAIDNFKAIDHPKKVGIIGSMKELGHISDEEHRLVVSRLKEGGYSRIYLIGDEFDFIESDDLIHRVANVEDLIETIKQLPIENAFILVKGSRGNRLEKVLPFIQ